MKGLVRTYSGVPITRAGSIKRAGRIFLQILINEQVLIRASRLEKIKILAVKLQAGRNFHDIFKNEQALLRASRLENDQKFLVRACSRNRDTRVERWPSIHEVVASNPGTTTPDESRVFSHSSSLH